MDFNLSPEQVAFKKTIGDFVEQEVRPKAKEFDEKGIFPEELFLKLGSLGFFGLRYPEEVGGLSQDTLTFCLCCEELAFGDLGLAASASMQCLMGTNFLFRFGTEDHKERLLKPALRGEKMGTIAFTEPGAGSDLGSMKTTVRREGDFYILKGAKTWITSAPLCDFFTVAATFSVEKGLKGIDFFLVEKGTPGFSVGRDIPKLGLRNSKTSELILDECQIPLENRLSEKEGSGFENMKLMLNEIRTMTGALSLGLGRAALEESLRYAKDRVQFGRPIAQFQAIQFKLAEMAVELEAAKHLVYYSAWLIDQKKEAGKTSAMAKLFASEAANKLADQAMRIFASYGFSMETNAQKLFRDARFLLVGGGTSEILKMILGKEIAG